MYAVMCKSDRTLSHTITILIVSLSLDMQPVTCEVDEPLDTLETSQSRNIYDCSSAALNLSVFLQVPCPTQIYSSHLQHSLSPLSLVEKLTYNL